MRRSSIVLALPVGTSSSSFSPSSPTPSHAMRLIAAIVLLVTSASCSVFQHQPIHDLGDPDQRLDSLLVELRDVRAVERGEVDAESERAEDLRGRRTVLADLETLAFDFPNHEGVRYACGAAAYESGRREQARVHLDAALDADPRSTRATALRARLSIEDGNYPRAHRLVDDGLLLAPDSVDLLLLEAQLAHLDGDSEAALVSLDLAERLGGPVARIDYHRALVYDQLGDSAQMEKALRRSLDADPDFAMARAQLNRLEAR